MNRRNFFRLIVGAAAAPMIPKPLLSLASPKSLCVSYIGRLSTPIIRMDGSYLTVAAVKRVEQLLARAYA